MNLALTKRTICGALLVLVSGASAIYAQAETTATTLETTIDTRQKGFKKMGSAMKSLRGDIKSGASDLAAITAAVEDIVNTAPLIAEWFPEGSGPESGLETDALSYIWKKPEKFNAANEALVAEAKTLLELAKAPADKSALMKQLLVVKDSCSNCHKSFRAD